MELTEELTYEQVERIHNRIEELDVEYIEDREQYDELFEYYKCEMLNGYLDEY